MAHQPDGCQLNQSSNKTFPSTPQQLLTAVAIAMLERDLAIGGVSVCPSVRLSHAGIESKLIIA